MEVRDLVIPTKATGLKSIQDAEKLATAIIDRASDDDIDQIEQMANQVDALMAAIRKIKPELTPPIYGAYKFARMRLGQLTPKRNTKSDRNDLTPAEKNRRWENAALAEFWDDTEIGEYVQKPTTSIKRIMNRVKVVRARKNGKRKTAKDLKNKIVYGAFQDIAESIADDSIDLIFTDPPWDRESVPMYGQLAEIAKRILVPGGSMLAYASSQLLPSILESVCIEGLRYYGLCADIRQSDESKLARLARTGLIIRFVPIVWMVKGSDRFDTSVMVCDGIITKPPDKTHHDWQQDQSVSEYYVERLSTKTGIVFDPFAGGGTTAAACKKLNREFISCDIDEQAIAKARKRLA